MGVFNQPLLHALLTCQPCALQTSTLSCDILGKNGIASGLFVLTSPDRLDTCGINQLYCITLFVSQKITIHVHVACGIHQALRLF